MVKSTHTKSACYVTSDEKRLLLFFIIEDGFPKYKQQLPPSMREYHLFKKHLYSSDGFVIHKHHIAIPPSLRPTHLSALCCPPGHLSNGSKSRSINFLAWHNKCHTDYNSKLFALQQDGLIPGSTTTHSPKHYLPQPKPYSTIYQDHSYLVFVDSYSNWPIVERVGDGATGLIKTLQHTFSNYDISGELSLDGGDRVCIPHD